jgi:hypothetical protein
MPSNPMEKYICWRSLQSLKDIEFAVDCILAGDFNVVRNSSEKRGGFFGWVPFRENLEELLVDWDMLDINPQKGRYTLSNMRSVLGHITAKLDHFLIHSNFLPQILL